MATKAINVSYLGKSATDADGDFYYIVSVENKGNIVSTEELFEAIWGEKYMDNNNTVMAHIGRLREKMKERAKNPKFIKTVWGVGYTIEK